MDRMRSVEIQARSAEEAIRLALEQLGCTREQVDVQVLAETEDDIYGEGEVLVRVAMRGTTAQPRGDRSQPRGQGAQGGYQQGRGGGRGPRTLADARPRDSRAPRTWQGGDRKSVV